MIFINRSSAGSPFPALHFLKPDCTLRSDGDTRILCSLIESASSPGFDAKKSVQGPNGLFPVNNLYSLTEAYNLKEEGIRFSETL